MLSKKFFSNNEKMWDICNFGMVCLANNGSLWFNPLRKKESSPASLRQHLCHPDAVAIMFRFHFFVFVLFRQYETENPRTEHPWKRRAIWFMADIETEHYHIVDAVGLPVTKETLFLMTKKGFHFKTMLHGLRWYSH